jgi:hypothetical protein
VCAGQHVVNLNFSEKNLAFVRRLKERGNVLSCEEDGTVSCELAVRAHLLRIQTADARQQVKRKIIS